MQEKSILLNSGKTHGVVLLRSAHAFLMRTLDTSSKRAVLLTLRSKQDRKGKQKVAVFVHSKHVGYLSESLAEDLLKAMQACARRGSTARARGTLSVSLDTPGKVQVTVSLADSDHLLSAPDTTEAESNETDREDQAERTDATTPASSDERLEPGEDPEPGETPVWEETPTPEEVATPVETSAPDETPADDEEGPAEAEEKPTEVGEHPIAADTADALESEVEPGPDEPDETSEPSALAESDDVPGLDETREPEPAPTSEEWAADDEEGPAVEDDAGMAEDGAGVTTEEEEPPTTARPTETSDISAGYVEDYPEWSPLKPIPPVTEDRPSSSGPPGGPVAFPPTAEPGTRGAPAEPGPTSESTPSLDAYLGTRSAWTPDMTNQSQHSQPGWLGYSARAADTSSDLSADTRSSESVRLDTAGFLTSGKAGLIRASGGGGDIDSEIAEAWRSSAPSTRKEPEAPPAKRSRRRRSSGSWVLPTVALLIIGGIAFLVWKFVFGPTTFTDPEYGYSFSHPGRWKVVDGEPIPPQFEYLVDAGRMPDQVIVGKGLDSEDPGDAAMMAVASGEVRGSTDAQSIAIQIQRDLYLGASPGTSLSVLDPTRATSVGGLSAWTTTVSLATASDSITVTYYVLLDGSIGHTLIAAATNDAWGDNRAAFDHFFDSFEPG